MKGNKSTIVHLASKRKKDLYSQLTGRKGRLIIILIGALIMFLVEFCIGLWLDSLSVIADSFHEINDAFAVIVALVIHTV